MKNFSDYYTNNAEYVNILEGVDKSSYEKYLAWMAHAAPGGRVLDVGAGTGYCANRLAALGFDSYGVDSNRLAIQEAAKGAAKFIFVDDYKLPFADGLFDAVGSINVLEHMADPEKMLREQLRVLNKTGILVIACPNFLQAAGLFSHHVRTRGLLRKAKNLGLLWKKSVLHGLTGKYSFTMMEPIRREVFENDDDAIVVTNAVDIRAFLSENGLKVRYASGTVTYHSPMMERIADLPAIRSLIGGVFIVASRAAS